MRVLGEQLQVDRTLYAEVEPDDEHFVIADNYVRGEFLRMNGRRSRQIRACCDTHAEEAMRRLSGAKPIYDIFVIIRKYRRFAQ